MSDVIKSEKELAGVATDLQDTEIQQVIAVVYQIQAKYAHRANTAANLEALRDEALTRLADIGVLATVDPSPCFYGEPPVIEIIGKVGDPGFKQEMDHERKAFEVRKATVRGEQYLGQKERPNKRRKKAS